LYNAFAKRFSNYADFWGILSEEEFKHAACLKSIRKQVQDDPAIVIVERFSKDAIEFSIQYVRGLIERAEQPDFTLLNAFSLATKLEEALLEKNFFEVLEGETEDIRTVLKILSNETERHLLTLRNAYRVYKTKSV
jgi:hypothetical protein